MPVPKKAKYGKAKKANSVAEPAVAYIAAKQRKTKQLKPLTDADWVRPGRPATDEEMEQLVKEMLNDKGRYTGEEVMESVKKALREVRATALLNRSELSR